MIKWCIFNFIAVTFEIFLIMFLFYPVLSCFIVCFLFWDWNEVFISKCVSCQIGWNFLKTLHNFKKNQEHLLHKIKMIVDAACLYWYSYLSNITCHETTLDCERGQTGAIIQPSLQVLSWLVFITVFTLSGVEHLEHCNISINSIWFH